MSQDMEDRIRKIKMKALNDQGIHITDEQAELCEILMSETGLSYMRGHIWPDRRKVKEKDGDSFVSRIRLSWEISIDGYRAIAHQSGNFAGVGATEFTYEKGFTHSGGQSKEPELVARVRVLKANASGGISTFVGEARWSEFVQLKEEWANNRRTGNWIPQGKWATAGMNQLSLAAERQALRKAFAGAGHEPPLVHPAEETGPVTLTPGQVIADGSETLDPALPEDEQAPPPSAGDGEEAQEVPILSLDYFLGFPVLRKEVWVMDIQMKDSASNNSLQVYMALSNGMVGRIQGHDLQNVHRKIWICLGLGDYAKKPFELSRAIGLIEMVSPRKHSEELGGREWKVGDRWSYVSSNSTDKTHPIPYKGEVISVSPIDGDSDSSSRGPGIAELVVEIMTGPNGKNIYSYALDVWGRPRVKSYVPDKAEVSSLPPQGLPPEPEGAVAVGEGEAAP